ncbi:MAG: FAD-dependent oxidoreductase [Marinosulfonomonas sp.]
MTWHKSIKAKTVLAAGATAVEVDGLRLALFALEGEIYCTANICTHAFAILTDGHVEKGCIECPLHQGLFDIKTGKAQGVPVTKDLATYDVKIEDGTVWIDTQPKISAAKTTVAEGENAASADPRRVVIVGAGQAGAETARALRVHGFRGAVTLIGDEPYAPYERPPLSKDLLLANTVLADAEVLETGQIAGLNLDLRTGLSVESIDRVGKTVQLSSGDPLAYDMLVLATGASARRLNLPGSDDVALHVLRDVKDAQDLRAAMMDTDSVAVIGGGFIGLEIASAARKIGRQAAVIETQDHLLSRLLPADPAKHLATLAQEQGVDLHLSANVERVSSEGVHLDDGSVVKAGCIVLGVGAVPNDTLAREAGLTCAKTGGVLVNFGGRSSDPSIWAVGDVGVIRDEVSGHETRFESWQNARLSADRAACTVLGLNPEQSEMPWFWSDLFGTTLQIVGQPDPGLTAHLCDGEKAPVFFCCDDTGRFKACIDFGQPELLETGRALIALDAPIDPEILKTPDIDLSPYEETHMDMKAIEKRFVWPASGLNRIPDWVYTDEEIHKREVEKIFHGPSWNYVALAAEVAEPGSYVRSFVGPTPVVVVRDHDGEINVFENRCSHRAAEFCRELRGKTEEFVCPYHQWSYDLKGNLTGIPFRRGVNGQGGMGPDFDPKNHGVRKLNVAQRNGAVFASFDDNMESIEAYLGEEMLKDYDAVFSGRPIKVLGHYRHTLDGNWKLYPENLKDPYHATLLHTFLVTFGLLVAGNKSAMIVCPRGRHSTMASAKSDGAVVSDENKAEMRAYRDGMTLADPRLMDFIPEFDSPWSVTMQVVWPNLIIQREMNTLGVRQIIPEGPNRFTMVWTMFGYEDDDDEMTRHRLRQGNLMGPAGFLGLEDNEAIKFVQDGMLKSTGGSHLVALDPDVPEGTSNTLISEAAIRAMYKYWRQEMGL